MKIKVMGTGMLALLVSAVCVCAATGDLSLVDAAKSGDRDAVRAILRDGQQVDVNEEQPDGATPLAWAVHRNDLEMADLLIAEGADVNAANEYGVTPLSLACTNRQPAMVRKLLQARANPNAAKWTGETILMTCSRAGDVRAVQALLDAGADVSARESQKGQTALMWAAAQKHADVVRALAAQGADVNAHSTLIEIPEPLRAKTYTKETHFRKTQGGFTALMFAARVGALDAAKALVEAGADINYANEEDGSALIVATASGNEELALFLVDAGADPKASDGYGITALHWSMWQGIKRLAGVNRSPTDKFWYRENMPRLARALLSQGADTNARIKNDFAPYDNFIFGHALGNNLPQITLVGATPFLLAAASGDTGTMKVLVEGRADPKLVTAESTDPLMVAAGVGREKGMYADDLLQRQLEAARMIIQLGGDVNAVNVDGRTALHGAVYLGDTDMIGFLASQGANMDVEDKYGQTPLSIALGDPEGKIYRQLEGDAFDYRFRRLDPSKMNKVAADLLVELGATPFTGEFRDRSGE